MGSTTIRVNEYVKQKLKIKSAETGISQYELANTYILDKLEEEEEKKEPIMTASDIKKFLKHDNPKGNGLSELAGVIKIDEVTDSVELKKKAFDRG